MDDNEPASVFINTPVPMSAIADGFREAREFELYWERAETGGPGPLWVHFDAAAGFEFTFDVDGDFLAASFRHVPSYRPFRHGDAVYFNSDPVVPMR
jgi:hypothetical protein